MRAKPILALGFATCALTVAPIAAGAAAPPNGGGAPPTSSPAPSGQSAPSTPSQPTVPGSVGKIRHGVAYAPSLAPMPVKKAIWAANALRHQPYVYGGGHASFHSRGYDCSGTVSYALHAAGLLRTPMDSSELESWGHAGRGRWITVYANPGHAWAIIAGMRLDTSGPGQQGPRWRTQRRSTSGYVARHAARY